ncbi:MAG: hypothetical protein ACYDG2_03180 [Ruminiclostridium sp.]
MFTTPISKIKTEFSLRHATSFDVPPKPHFVIRIILSTCLEDIKKMPSEPGVALAAEC